MPAAVTIPLPELSLFHGSTRCGLLNLWTYFAFLLSCQVLVSIAHTQVTRARLLTHLRSSRYLSPEDLIFLIRDDRGKVNRLRTYLSWKDVRKRAKEDDPGHDVEVDLDEAGERDVSISTRFL